MPKKSLFGFVRSISLKVSLILLVLIIVLFTLNSTLCYRRQLVVLEENVRNWAFHSGSLIKEGLYRMMLFNKRDDLHQTILSIGKESQIERARIYNKQGEIKFSNKESEIGELADLTDQACRYCHNGYEPPVMNSRDGYTYIYRNGDDRILELINPILNNPDCSNAACHFHQPEQKVLGVLNVQISLRDLDETIYRARRNTYLVSILFVLLSLLLIAIILYFILHVPFKNLRLGTNELANGNLDYRIEMNRKDEFGLLARSFNSMADNLQKAYHRLKAFSQDLEIRVQRKSEELERMHQGMIHVEKMSSLGMMAATVAHELNNPLTGIVTYAKLLQKKVKRLLSDDVNQPLLDELELIRTESMRCGNIVKDLLLFARESNANFVECEIDKIIQLAINIVKHHLELAGVKHKIANNLNNQKIVCDSGQLGQALVALFVNAVEAMPEGGDLDICVAYKEGDDNKVVIKIKDSGAGIPAEIQEKIFEPFFSTKEDTKGVGLGLAVVYGIIQRHKGKIWLESQADAGTTFFIELPLDPRSAG